jgi:valyl-tRNA synthetase
VDGSVFVGRSKADAAALAGTDQLTQDPDVLDTWFSSALWPFSTLGWPEKTADLETFYPSSVLVTARDIIFLWVSRMVMTGAKFIGREPFADVFVTGTVLDKHGQRMSKTKNNGVDPLDVFDKYGVDATRLVLASIGSTDTRWNDKQVESYRNFANKIWNASRFALMNSEGARIDTEAFAGSLALHDRWILSRLNKAVRRVNSAIEKYEFHDAVQTLYHFFWDDFCDWYLELSKQEVTAEVSSPGRDAARSRLVTLLEQALRLLHPFMPYITEELWQRLPGDHAALLHNAYKDAEPTIMLAAFPQCDETLIDERAEFEMQSVIELITRVRNIRSELMVKPGDRVKLIVNCADESLRRVFESSTDQIDRIARASEIMIGSDVETPSASARAVLVGGAEVAVPLEGVVDFAQERERLGKELEKLEKEDERLKSQLANEQFIERAPAEKVAEIRERVSDIAQRLKALAEMLEALG